MKRTQYAEALVELEDIVLELDSGEVIGEYYHYLIEFASFFVGNVLNDEKDDLILEDLIEDRREYPLL